MRSVFLLLLSFAVCSCGGESEQLNDDELEFVNISVTLGKIKATARDSAEHTRLRDSIYRAFSTTHEAFQARTEAMTDRPERTAIIFRAIGDSLEIR